LNDTVTNAHSVTNHNIESQNAQLSDPNTVSGKRHARDVIKKLGSRAGGAETSIPGTAG
jgi:hypothetical protein